jgi:hypothetical protein
MTSAKLKAFGKFVQSQAGCQAKAAKTGEAVDTLCETKAEAKLQTAFAKAQQKADCVASGDDADLIEAVAGAFVADTAAILEPPPGVCCSEGGLCGWAVDAATCIETAGVPGAAGTVCSAGACSAPPAAPSPCCDGTSVSGATGCAAGPLGSSACEAAGGTFFVGSICPQSRECVQLP